MFDYSRKHEWSVNNVRFEYLGGRYAGRGLLSWDPNQGFHLEAFLSRTGKPVPNEIEFGKLRIPPPPELRRIRMSVGMGTRAVSAALALGDHHEIIADERLSIHPPSVLFFLPWQKDGDSTTHNGAALLDVGDGLVLPDTVKSNTHLAERLIEQSQSAGGIFFEDEGMKLRAWLVSKTHLKMEWALEAQKWTRHDAWRWAEAAQAALSFLGGRTVQMLERSTVRGRSRIVERLAPGIVTKLGLLSLPPREHRTPDRIDKELFVTLTQFFLTNSKEAFVARNMCAQMAEAARQQSRAAAELLCSTILEAALRTIDDHKFQPGDNSWKIDQSMRRFRERYLSDEWEKACATALQLRKRLRHRNAHPDWLTQDSGALSDSALEQSLDDLIQLSWFYGYIIFAMAGVPNLTPKFPGPHNEWPAIVTLRKGHTV